MGFEPIGQEALRDEIARLQKDASELGDRVVELSSENVGLRRERDRVRLALAAVLVDSGYTRAEAANRADVSLSALRRYLRDVGR